MTGIQALVAEFQTAFEQEPDVEMQLGLVREEFLEVHEAVHHTGGDIFEMAKEIADLLYVTYGLAHMVGIDADTVVRAVHASNMSKLGEDGKPVYREDGKILKGPGYWPPTPSKEWFYNGQEDSEDA